eukprot:55532_1
MDVLKQQNEMDTRLNSFIIHIFNMKEFDDVTTFILRVLYGILEMNVIWMGLTETSTNLYGQTRKVYENSSILTEIIEWSKDVYNTYFDPETIPFLYSRLCWYSDPELTNEIDASMQQHLYHTAGLDALKYSQMYLKQRKDNNLTYLSKLFNEWTSNNKNFSIFEEMHFGYLMQIRNYYYLMFNAKSDDEKIVDLYGKFTIQCITFFMQNQHLFHRINHQDGGKFTLMYDILELIITKSEQHNSLTQIINKKFNKKIEKLCHKYYKSIISKNNQYHHMKSCGLMGYYYFWHRYNIPKAMKYMYKGFECMKNEGLMAASYTNSLYNMQYAAYNFEECIKINKLELNFYIKNNNQKMITSKKQQIKGLRNMQITQGHLKNNKEFVLNNIRSSCLIMYSRFGNELIRQKLSNLLGELKLFVNNKKYYNIMKNVIQLKQCNYIQCNRKDLRLFKVCSRCKSVYYCGKKHQKLDWNSQHRNECINNSKRVYSLARYQREINDQQKRIAVQLFV